MFQGSNNLCLQLQSRIMFYRCCMLDLHFQGNSDNGNSAKTVHFSAFSETFKALLIVLLTIWAEYILSTLRILETMVEITIKKGQCYQSKTLIILVEKKVIGMQNRKMTCTFHFSKYVPEMEISLCTSKSPT